MRNQWAFAMFGMGVSVLLLSPTLMGCGDDGVDGGRGGGGSSSIPAGDKWVITCTGDKSFTDSSPIVSIHDTESEDVVLGLIAGTEFGTFRMSSGVAEGTTGTSELDEVQLMFDGEPTYEGGTASGTTFTLTLDEWDTDHFSNGPAGSFDGDLVSSDTGATVHCAGDFDFNASAVMPGSN